MAYFKLRVTLTGTSNEYLAPRLPLKGELEVFETSLLGGIIKAVFREDGGSGGPAEVRDIEFTYSEANHRPRKRRSENFKKTPTRLLALRMVSNGAIRNLMASGCTWQDRRGDGLGRGLAQQLTHANYLGLIRLEPSKTNPKLRIAFLTDKGRTLLAEWRSQK